MHAPAFWSQQRRSLAAAIFFPVALLYDLAVRTRFRLANPAEIDIDVICVGNFVTGGAGKTPTAIAIAELLKSEGKTPAFLSRGYGGSDPGPTLIDLEHANAQQFGDEPLLLARIAPAIVAKNRRLGARLAAKSRADIVVMDDGMQNPSLHKSITLAVVDSYRGVGNGAVFPAGPLRASLEFQFGLIDGLIVVGNGTRADEVIDRASRRAIPIFRADITPHRDTITVKNQPVVAYAGIGFPEKFFDTLKDAGAELVATRSFPDHHRYTHRDAEKLLELAAKTGGTLITTEKDMARLEGDSDLAALKEASADYRIILNFENTDAVLKLIREKTTL